MNEREKQFSFTRVAPSTSGHAKKQIPISILILLAAFLCQQSLADDANSKKQAPPKNNPALPPPKPITPNFNRNSAPNTFRSGNSFVVPKTANSTPAYIPPSKPAYTPPPVQNTYKPPVQTSKPQSSLSLNPTLNTSGNGNSFVGPKTASSTPAHIPPSKPAYTPPSVQNTYKPPLQISKPQSNLSLSPTLNTSSNGNSFVVPKTANSTPAYITLAPAKSPSPDSPQNNYGNPSLRANPPAPTAEEVANQKTIQAGKRAELLMVPMQAVKTAADAAFEIESEDLGVLGPPANWFYHNAEDQFSDPHLQEKVQILDAKRKQENAEYQAKQKAYLDTVNKGLEESNEKIQRTLDGIVSPRTLDGIVGPFGLQTNRSPVLGTPTPAH